MKCPARVTRKPGLHLWMFVGRVVVDDGFDQFPGGNRALDIVEEADELFVPVPLHAAPDHRAVQEVESGEQGRRAVALVIVLVWTATDGIDVPE
jgi:hypothetical protein